MTAVQFMAALAWPFVVLCVGLAFARCAQVYLDLKATNLVQLTNGLADTRLRVTDLLETLGDVRDLYAAGAAETAELRAKVVAITNRMGIAS